MGRAWDDGHVQLLIETLREYEKLWNTKHLRYTESKRIRHRFWKEATKIFNDAHKEEEYSSLDVQHKWNALRIKFHKEYKKLTDLGKKGSSWRYYNSLTFLAGHPVRKREIRVDNRKQYALRKAEKRKSGTDTDVSVGSISPRNRREKKRGQESFNSHETTIQNNEVKTDDETDYVSIGSVSPPYFREDDGHGFYLTKDEL